MSAPKTDGCTCWALGLVLLAFLPACRSQAGSRIPAVVLGEASFAAMIEDLGQARLVLVGERHNEPADHRAQLAIIQALHEQDRDLAIGLEMVQADRQAPLDRWIAGQLPEEELAASFQASWGFGWHLYRALFRYAREHGIPMVGLNVPPAITRQVGRAGFASLSAQERASLPPAVSCDVDPRYGEHLQRVFRTQGGHSQTFVHFCEAQVLWDQAMAWHISRHLEAHPQRTMVVLAGAIHAWRLGIPRQLNRFFNAELRVILPEPPAGGPALSPTDADYLLLS
ncbi:MAG: ChaN family lipoprotein [Thermodesulfobacteriota bacterium]